MAVEPATPPTPRTTPRITPMTPKTPPTLGIQQMAAATTLPYQAARRIGNGAANAEEIGLHC